MGPTLTRALGFCKKKSDTEVGEDETLPGPQVHEVLNVESASVDMKNMTLGDSQGVVEGSHVVEEPAALELEQRQHAILQKLENLQKQVSQLTSNASITITPATTAKTSSEPKSVTLGTAASTSNSHTPLSFEGLHDIVINASPTNPPLTVLVLAEMLGQQSTVLQTCHIHSSALTSTPEKLKSFMSANSSITNRNGYKLAITLIWKDVKHGPNMMVSPRVQTSIEGESNIARYLGRLLNPAYDATDFITATDIDQWLDQASVFISGTNKERAGVLRTVNAHLGKAQWLVGSQLSLADIVLWSAIQQTGQADSVPNNVKKWLQSCNNHPAFQTALKTL